MRKVRKLATRILRGRGRSLLRAWLPLGLVLAGVLVLLYPVVATQHNNADQQRLAGMYSARLDSLGPDALGQSLAAAETYNANLESSPILDPWLEAQRPDTPRYQSYLQELSLDEVMGRVTIPSIHVDLPVYHGTQPSVLQKGVGHLFGTSLPVGGASTHAVLTGHTGLGTSTMFDNLVDVKEGDAFYVMVAGRVLKYQVVDIQVVLPTQTDSLDEVAGRDLVTLITCTPYGVNSHRLLVTGERVPMDPAAAQADAAGATPAPMQTWQVVILWVVAVVLVVVAAVLVWRLVVTIGRRRRRGEPGGLPEDDGNGGEGGQGPAPSHPAAPLGGGCQAPVYPLVHPVPENELDDPVTSKKLDRELIVTIP